MDITNFMTWFISKIVEMFSWFFGILDNITFMGTSLLKVCLTISIISCLIPILLTIGKSGRVQMERSERVDRSTRKESEGKNE